MEAGEQTSLKGLFQGMIPESVTVVMGKVMSASPLKIQVINDEKLLLSENLICVPRHLSDYTTTATFTVNEDNLSSSTVTSRAHGVLTVHNALKAGETVYLLSFNEGKKYYVLDREA